MTEQNRHLLALSAQIVAAHAANNALEIGVLPSMIRNVFNALAQLDSSVEGGHGGHFHKHADHEHPEHDHDGHRVSHAYNGYVHPIYGQTVFRDHLICMEDGLSMKMLKRHLLTVHGMTPEEYRAKWGLQESYPMVAADYAKLRSSLAVQSGLGLKPESVSGKWRKSRKP